MFELYLILALIGLGYIFGRRSEKKHFESIIRREKVYQSLPVVTLKNTQTYPSDVRSELVTGSVVISIDYFKRLLAGLRNLFGGRVSSYESLLDRTRREAILRMKEQAWELGAEVILNTRLETSSITKSSSGTGSVGSVEVVAYGTALIRPKSIQKFNMTNEISA